MIVTIRSPSAVALLMLLACTPSPNAQLEANKQLVRQFAQAANAADWDGVAALVAEDFVRHSAATPGPQITSRDAFIQLQQSILVSIPDNHVTIQQLVAEGDRVAALATYAGTQAGPMGGFPATGRAFESPFLSIFRIEEGRIAELWVEWDNVHMLTQLGLFPPAPGPSN